MTGLADSRDFEGARLWRRRFMTRYATRRAMMTSRPMPMPMPATAEELIPCFVILMVDDDGSADCTPEAPVDVEVVLVPDDHEDAMA
jgi:hypothetical protein